MQRGEKYLPLRAHIQILRENMIVSFFSLFYVHLTILFLKNHAVA